MSQLVIDRHPAKIHYFTEDLGNGVTMDMVLIPSGSFEMGSSEIEMDRLSREDPQHRVTVPAFFIGRFPVTQRQWQQVAKLPPEKNYFDYLALSPSHFKGDDQPVEKVSWIDASKFCERLSRLTSRTYNLPSEAQWEYACRAGTTTPFHFGETIDAELANYQAQDEKTNNTTYSGRYGRGRTGEYRQQTTPVDMFPPNSFGLHDMHGNVWEWCQDCWHDSYRDAPTDGSAWWKDKQLSPRVVRGGSWSDFPGSCRSAFRFYYSPSDRLSIIGFRVVCIAPRIFV